MLSMLLFRRVGDSDRSRPAVSDVQLAPAELLGGCHATLGSQLWLRWIPNVTTRIIAIQVRVTQYSTGSTGSRKISQRQKSNGKLEASHRHERSHTIAEPVNYTLPPKLSP